MFLLRRFFIEHWRQVCKNKESANKRWDRIAQKRRKPLKFVGINRPKLADFFATSLLLGNRCPVFPIKIDVTRVSNGVAYRRYKRSGRSKNRCEFLFIQKRSQTAVAFFSNLRKTSNFEFCCWKTPWLKHNLVQSIIRTSVFNK